MRYGLYDARGYDYPVERRYDRLWRHTVAGQRASRRRRCRSTDRRGLRALGLLGVTDLIEPPRRSAARGCA